MIVSETSFVKVEGASSPISVSLLWLGDPSPSPNDVTWYFNGQEVTESLRTSLDLYFAFDAPVRLLTLQGLDGYTMEMEGTYRCNVTTSAGNGSDAFFLDILCK